MSDTPTDPAPDTEPAPEPEAAPVDGVTFNDTGVLVLDGTEIPEATGELNTDGTVTLTTGTVTNTVEPTAVPTIVNLIRIYGVPGATPTAT